LVFAGEDKVHDFELDIVGKIVGFLAKVAYFHLTRHCLYHNKNYNTNIICLWLDDGNGLIGSKIDEDKQR
jgi:hypothetical protein